jgi:hypothetical protein
MLCNTCDESFRRQYPDPPMKAIFISWSGTAVANTNIGYLDELERLGSATSAPEYRILRPVTDISELFKGTVKIFIESLDFYGYDVTLTGSTHQDADTLTAIYNSRTANDALAQSLYKNAMVMNWQPNWFRPFFQINKGKNIIKGLDKTFETPNHLGDLGIGLPCPTCMDVNYEFGRLTDFTVRAALAQYIPGTELFQNYMIMCIATIWNSKK